MADLVARTRSMSSSSRWKDLLMIVVKKRRTWVTLFLVVYAILISSSWNLLLSIRSWSFNSSSSSSSPLPAAIYAAAIYGVVFGLLSMGAALAVAIPATLVTWITILVLLAFAGKPRSRLVGDGRRITADIVGFALRILVREGNLVAATCAVVSFFAIVLKKRQIQQEEGL